MEEGGEEVNVRDQEGDGEPALELGAQAAQGGAEELVHQARGRTSRAVALAVAVAVAVALALAVAVAVALALALLEQLPHRCGTERQDCATQALERQIQLRGRRPPRLLLLPASLARAPRPDSLREPEHRALQPEQRR